MNKQLKVLLIISVIGFFLATPVAAEFKIEEAKINIPFGNLPATLNSFSIDPCKCSEADNPVSCAKKEQNQCVNIPWIAMYIGEAYRYGVVIGSVLSVIMMMIGGLMYILGGFNQTMITKARGFLTGGAIGIFLLLGSYVMLHLVNPNLVVLKPLQMEVAREEIPFTATFCDEAGKNGFAVVDSDWNKGNDNCGIALPIKLIKETSSATSTGLTCVSNYCQGKKSCVQSLETNKWGCADVAMHGSISYPSDLNVFFCGSVTQAALGAGFYLDNVELFALEPKKEIPVSVSSNISVGKEKHSYSINYDDLNLSGVDDSAQILLEIEVNDAGWPFFATFDDVFKTASASKLIGDVLPVLICGDNVNGFEPFVYKGGKGIMYQSLEKLTVGDLKAAGKSVRWNVNITKNIYDCANGATVDKIGFCKNAQGASGSLAGKVGDTCIKQSDCGVGLNCGDGNICVIPGDDSAHCNGNNDCKSGFYCNDKLANGTCMASTTLGFSCDPDVAGSCISSLICDDETEKCVDAPPACTINIECSSSSLGKFPGWNGDCSDNFCDCDSDSGCTDGYYCADNLTDSFGGNDSCVKKQL